MASVTRATPMKGTGRDHLFVLDLDPAAGAPVALERVAFRQRQFLLVSSASTNERGELQAMALRLHAS